MMNHIREFVAICDYISRKKDIIRKNGFMIADREMIEAMLNQNKYEPAKDKLKTWKALNWISTDEDRLTKRFYKDKKYVAMIFLDEKVYRELKRLSELEVRRRAER